MPRMGSFDDPSPGWMLLFGMPSVLVGLAFGDMDVIVALLNSFEDLGVLIAHSPRYTTVTCVHIFVRI